MPVHSMTLTDGKRVLTRACAVSQFGSKTSELLGVVVFLEKHIGDRVVPREPSVRNTEEMEEWFGT